VELKGTSDILCRFSSWDEALATRGTFFCVIAHHSRSVLQFCVMDCSWTTRSFSHTWLRFLKCLWPGEERYNSTSGQTLYASVWFQRWCAREPCKSPLLVLLHYGLLCHYSHIVASLGTYCTSRRGVVLTGRYSTGLPGTSQSVDHIRTFIKHVLLASSRVSTYSSMRCSVVLAWQQSGFKVLFPWYSYGRTTAYCDRLNLTQRCLDS